MHFISEYCNQLLLLFGIVFTAIGTIMYIFPPKKINFLYGYRTKNSMKNQQTWDFSQKYSSKKMALLGLIFIFLSFSKGVFNTTEETDFIFGMAAMIIGTIAMLFLVEQALKKSIKKEEF